MPDLFGQFVVAYRHGMYSVDDGKLARAQVKLNVCIIADM